MADRANLGVTALAAAAAALALAACGERTDTVAEREAVNREQAAQVHITPDDNRSAGKVETHEGTPETTATMGGPGRVHP